MDDIPRILLASEGTGMDRGLAYGDGFFETLRMSNTQVPLQHWHLRRFLHAAAVLHLPVDETHFSKALETVRSSVSGPGDWVVKLLVSAGTGGRGYHRPTKLVPQLHVLHQPFEPRPALQREQGIRLVIADTVCPDGGVLAGLKHLNRLPQVLAAREAGLAGVEEALMLDAAGRPLELTSMNLFARFADRWWTPSLGHAGVAGVMREYLLEQGAISGITISTNNDITLPRLLQADELFACNSVAGILPVQSLGERQWPVGEATRQLQQQVARLFAQG